MRNISTKGGEIFEWIKTLNLRENQVKTMWSVAKAQNLALKVEMMEKANKPLSYFNDRGRQTSILDRVVIPFKGGESSKTLEKIGNPNQN